MTAIDATSAGRSQACDLIRADPISRSKPPVEAIDTAYTAATTAMTTSGQPLRTVSSSLVSRCLYR